MGMALEIRVNMVILEHDEPPYICKCKRFFLNLRSDNHYYSFLFLLVTILEANQSVRPLISEGKRERVV